MKYEQEQEVLRFSFEGEFDNLSVMRIKDESIALIERFRPKVLKLDFADVTFVDSSGIGYVLARYQQLRKWQGEVVLCNLTRLNQTIFEMSGIFQIIRYLKAGWKMRCLPARAWSPFWHRCICRWRRSWRSRRSLRKVWSMR